MKRVIAMNTDSAIDVELVDVKDVARMLCCSTRHVFRLNDAGKMPMKVKLFSLARWRRSELVAWIAAGCPSNQREQQ